MLCAMEGDGGQAFTCIAIVTTDSARSVAKKLDAAFATNRLRKLYEPQACRALLFDTSSYHYRSCRLG